ncbi:SemiSWEET family sugar transporter [Ferruginibacter sp. SUN002]|uniref:SemiSWEET family sugar transporter n=1 Tax=Ferruginibacter sp. SUN002 TaxID=2937789 RepID=UPI003D35ADF6
MDWTEVIGHTGSALSSITFMPQVYQAWKTKSVGDLNLMTILIVFISTVIWVIYGSMKGILPVIICNSIICFLSMVLLYFKFTFKKS